jgi:hypothetical protein
MHRRRPMAGVDPRLCGRPRRMNNPRRSSMDHVMCARIDDAACSGAETFQRHSADIV